MSKRKQLVTLDVVEGNILFLPKGLFDVHIDSTWVEDGSITFRGRVVATLPLKQMGMIANVGEEGEKDA
jgi:hypothetical protein